MLHCGWYEPGKYGCGGGGNGGSGGYCTGSKPSEATRTKSMWLPLHLWVGSVKMSDSTSRRAYGQANSLGRKPRGSRLLWSLESRQESSGDNADALSSSAAPDTLELLVRSASILEVRRQHVETPLQYMLE